MELNCICALYEIFTNPSNWKDYIIPILSGVMFPLLIFLFTVWKDFYNKLFANYTLREAIYFKNEAIIDEVIVRLSYLQTTSNGLTLNNHFVEPISLISKNVRDIESLPFERVIEVFHNELNEDRKFRTIFDNYNDSVNEIVQFYEHFPKFVFEYNGQVMDLHNLNSRITKKVYEYTLETINRIERRDFEFSYWNNIYAHLIQMNENPNPMESDLYNDISILKELILDSQDSDLVSVTLLKDAEEILANYIQILNSIKELKEQMEMYIVVFSSCERDIRKFQSLVRTKRPKKTHFWKYFLDK